MTTPRQSESSANAALAELLQGMMHGATARAEHTRLIADQPALRPDVLITDDARAPVVVEAEYLPAPSVEDEAKSRLNLPVVGDSRPIEAAVALRYPAALRATPSIRAALKDARPEYAVHYKNGARFPKSGWLTGSLADLADLIRMVSIPQSEVDAAADALERGIERAVDALNNLARLLPFVAPEIARLLGMPDEPPTRRMACAILANALIFHSRLARIHPEIKPLDTLWQTDLDNPKTRIIEVWDEILELNYWAIFAIARDILSQLPAAFETAAILNRLRETALNINMSGALFAHDLTGRIFQRLIADRKYLATFYTLPASSALLAQLAVAKLNGTDWADADAIGKLRVADFACGTGALLSAVYEQFANRYERAGGDPADLHKAMMEDVLYGCDVMPSAIHISGSTLSGIQPGVGFDLSRLYSMPYGRQSDGGVQIGSLELLQTSSVLTLFNTNDPARRTGSIGEETASQITAEFPDESFDIVIMNPPFTRSTNHEGAHHDVVNPAFAAFGAPAADQTEMGNRLSGMRMDNCYHGNAGLASAFVAVADRKLRPGGVLAFVLPLAAASGLSWQKFRQMLAAGYTDLTVVSIAANGKEMAFSSDTGMAECLVAARKLKLDETPSASSSFISLTRRPDGFAQAHEIAKSISGIADIRSISDGPYGGARIEVGDELVGEIVQASQSGAHNSWGAVRIRDYSLTQTAHALAQSQLWLPAQPDPLRLKTAALGVVGKLGLVDRDINGPAPRGPFDRVAPSPTATYPALWNHHAPKETRMVCEPDAQLQARRGMESKSAQVWATASRAHLNRNFTFGSQPLAVAFTERETIGGSAWPNVIFGDERFDYAFAVWGNSTLGLLSWWHHSSRQQSSKAGITIRMAESLPTLDLLALTDAQLAAARAIFDEFRDLDFLPAYLADADPNRALLDRRVLCDLLDFPESVYRAVRLLAQKWCAEPSVHGGKPRPKNARFIA